MDERLFDEARPLDAIVGLPLESRRRPASLSSGAGGDALSKSVPDKRTQGQRLPQSPATKCLNGPSETD